MNSGGLAICRRDARLTVKPPNRSHPLKWRDSPPSAPRSAFEYKSDKIPPNASSAASEAQEAAAAFAPSSKEALHASKVKVGCCVTQNFLMQI